LLVASLVLVTLVVGACSNAPVATSWTAAGQAAAQVVPVEGGGQYTDILPQELNTMLQNKDFFFVNVSPTQADRPDGRVHPVHEVEARLGDPSVPMPRSWPIMEQGMAPPPPGLWSSRATPTYTTSMAASRQEAAGYIAQNQ
jgi:hypothetical protein